MIITDRGQNTAFLESLTAETERKNYRQFLLEEGWRSNPPWKTSYAPVVTG